MNIVWEPGELAGPKWDARVVAPSMDDGSETLDYFYLAVWNLAPDATADFEWAWEVLYYEDNLSVPQVMGSGIAGNVEYAKVAAVIGLGDILAQSNQVDYRPDAKPLDRCR